MRVVLSAVMLISILWLMVSCGGNNKGITLVKATASEELYVVRKDSLQGFVNGKGEWVIAPIYNTAYPFTDGYALVEKDTTYQLIDRNGVAIKVPNDYVVATFAQGLAPVKIKGKTGFINAYGKLVVPAEYDTWSLPNDGMHLVVKNGKYYYIDSLGKVLPGEGYDDAGNFSEGLGCVKIGDKYGYIDKAGKFVVAAKYDFAVPFAEGLASVGIGNKLGFIDATGKEFIPIAKDHIGWTFCKGTIWFAEGEGDAMKYGLIDKTGKEVVPAKYDKIEGVTANAADNKIIGWRTYQGKKRGIVDGTTIIEPAYDFVEVFSEGLAAAGNQTDSGIILSGYIDTTGKWAIKPQFFGVKDFSSGMAGVSLANKQGKGWGFIDKTGTIVIEPAYFEVGSFHGNRAFVNPTQTTDAIIDRNGKETKF